MNTTLQTEPAQDIRPVELPFGIPAIAWFVGLLILCYVPILYSLVNHWMVDEDMGHGFFVPVIAGYIAWQKRAELAAAPLKTNSFGLVILALAAAQSIIGTLGAELFVSRTAFLFSVIGTVLYMGGMPAIRVLAFPLFLLFFMVPIPAIIYNQITFPLQLLASRVAEVALSAIGIPVLRDGNVLELPSQKLSVVEACSGIRSLLSLSFLSLVYGFFFDTKAWMKWWLLLSTVPIAITANASRVTLTGILSEINTEYASGVYHSASGWVVFMVALIFLVMVHSLTNRIVARKPKGA
ncbi:MAG: exosortase/archaeosortase family protein [Bryobacteraceae bacterium]